MKGIILHGGHGTRLRPLTHTGPKQLLPIANKPMSQYALEDLIEAGIKEIAIIIGGPNNEKVKEFYGDGKNFGVKITYIFQDEPKGISHAIRLCKDFVGDDKFIVYLGDNVLRDKLSNYAKKFESTKKDAMILLGEVKNPSLFGVVLLEDSKIKKIVEKPKVPPSNIVVIGVYFLKPIFFDIIDKLKPSWRNELEITDALQLFMDEGFSIDYDIVTGWWKDTGTPEDVLHANQLILDTIGTPDQFKLNSDAQVKENIMIGKNSCVDRDTFIKGPVIIGNHCKIGPSVRLGPHVSIGDHSVLKNCNIENSIIMDGCKIDSKIHIYDSIVSRDSKISDNPQPKKHQFLLGERSEVRI